MMQHVMKAHNKVGDFSTICLITPKKQMSQAIQKEQEAFLTSVIDCWGPKTTIKDLGPNTLNVVPIMMDNTMIGKGEYTPGIS